MKSCSCSTDFLIGFVFLVVFRVCKFLLIESDQIDDCCLVLCMIVFFLGYISIFTGMFFFVDFSSRLRPKNLLVC